MEETSVVPDVQAESSPAPQPQELDLSTLTREERQSWRETGVFPDKAEKKAAPKEESSDAEPEEGEAESSPVSETEERQEPTPHKKRSDAQSRIQQLVAEKKQREARIAELESQLSRPKEDVKAEPSPAPADELKAPKVDDFETYDQYVEALADYKAEVKVRQLKAEQAQQAAMAAVQKQLNDAKARYQDFEAVASPVITALTDKAVHPAVINALDNAENMADVLYAIGGDQQTVNEIVEAAKKNPLQAIKKIAVYEYLVKEEMANASKPAVKEEKKVPEKPVTNAPKPVTELGGGGTSTEDPAKAAARSGFNRATKDAFTREYLARHK